MHINSVTLQFGDAADFGETGVLDRQGRKRKRGGSGAGRGGRKRLPRDGDGETSSSESGSNSFTETESESDTESHNSSDDLSPQEDAIGRRKKRVKMIVRAQPFTRKRKGRTTCPNGAATTPPRGSFAAQSTSRAVVSPVAATEKRDDGRVRVDISGNVHSGNYLEGRKEAKKWKLRFQQDLEVDEQLEPNAEGNRQSNLRVRATQRTNHDEGASMDMYQYIDSKFRTAFRNDCSSKKQLRHLRTVFGEFAENVILRMTRIEDFSASAAGFRNVETRLKEIQSKIKIPFTNQEDMRSAFECKQTKELLAHYIFLMGRQVTGKKWVNDMMSHVSYE